MNDNHPARSPFDRVPFAIRALLAGALALSMLFLSAAAGLILIAFAVGATPGRHLRLDLPSRTVVIGVHSQPKCPLARTLRAQIPRV
jgi:hypothetical protein